MKKTFTLSSVLTIVLSLFISNASFAQQTCTWAKKTGGTAEDWGTAVTTDNSGNVYYLGNFFSTTVNIGGINLSNQPSTYSNQGAEMFLAKFDSCGNFLWAKKAGGNDDTRGKAVATDASGNIFVVGYGRSDTTTFGTVKMFNYSLYDGFVAKYNSSGVTQWVKRIQGNYNDRAYALSIDNTGNLFVSGSFQSTYVRCGLDSVANQNTNNNDNVFVLKLDNNGNEQWIRAGKGDYNAYGMGISNDAAGNCYTTGTFGGSHIRFGNDSLALVGYYDIFLVKHDANGNVQWLRTAGGTDDDEANAVATDAAGNSYITGFIGTNSTINFGPVSLVNTNISLAPFITKYDASGTALWARKAQGIPYSYSNQGTSVKLDNTQNPIVTGFYNSDSLQMGAVTLKNQSIVSGSMAGGNIASDIFIAKYKSNGVLSWARTCGGDSSDFCFSIATGPNNALYITGEYKSPSITFNNGLTLTSVNSAGDAFIANNVSSSSETPSICLVTTDSTSTNNIIFWDKTPYTDVNSFLIYREVSSGIYKWIGSQPYSALSQFVDVNRSVGPANGDPNIGTYRYKIQTLDTAGNLGKMSPYHNTVHFQDNGSGTFTWNLYSVENMTITPVSNFNLMRDDFHTGVWNVIGTVAGTQLTTSDPNYATYLNTGDWRVQALGFNCTPTARYSNGSAPQAAIIKSKSNITNNRGIGINQVVTNNNGLLLYPNPAANNITVSSAKELGTITVYNSLGEMVYQIKTKNTEEQIDISKFPRGIYILQALSGHIKLIKE
ncbi:MAG TPA: T9SS type A sorting domain-containing protein [Bacteroidia bacterium]|jgi:hypothetical protein|nr:T9SS type A sorting domain-containing protein [Bacteroidia bacterium]